MLHDLARRLGAEQRQQRRDLLAVARPCGRCPCTRGSVTVGKKSLMSIFTTSAGSRCAAALVSDRPAGEEAVRGAVDGQLLDDVPQDPALGQP